MSKLKSKPKIMKAITMGLKHDQSSPIDWRRSGLSEKEYVWAENYLQHFNATRASERVGCPGDARKHGWRMKQNPKVQTYIDARMAEHRLSANEVLARLSEHARANMDDFLTGEAIDIQKARKNGKTHLIRRYRKGKNGQSIELVDSLTALKMLAAIHGLIKKRGSATHPTRGFEIPTEWP